MTKTLFIKADIDLFGNCFFGYWDLFGFCYLKFGIYLFGVCKLEFY